MLKLNIIYTFIASHFFNFLKLLFDQRIYYKVWEELPEEKVNFHKQIIEQIHLAFEANFILVRSEHILKLSYHLVQIIKVKIKSRFLINLVPNIVLISVLSDTVGQNT